MENLDDFMRQKFNTGPDASGERFEFREEYWEQAQALLEAEEARRRKRRRWLLRWVFVGAVAVAVGWWQWPAFAKATAGEGSWREQSAEDIKGGSGRSGSGSSNEQPLSGGAVGRSSRANDVQEKGGDAGQGSVSGEKTPGADSSFLKNKTENQSFGTKKEITNEVAVPEQRTGKNGAKPAPTTPAQQHQASNETSTTATPSQQNMATAKSGTPDQPSPTGQNTADSLAAQNAPNDFNSNPPSHKASTGKNDPNDYNDFNDFPPLPTLLNLLQLPERNLDTPSFAPFVRPIEPVRERRFGFGLMAAGTLGPASPDSKRLGGTGGVFAAYRIAPAWSLTGGASWRFVPGDWRGGDSTTAGTSTQLRYGFGYQQDEWRLETQGLHFAELSLGVQWRRGPFGAEAGIEPGFLLGVQGRQVQRRSASLQSEISTSSSRVGLDKSPYRSAHMAVFLGTEWRAARWLGLSLRGTYRPGSLLKPVSDAPPPGNLFWLDAGLRWHF